MEEVDECSFYYSCNFSMGLKCFKIRREENAKIAKWVKKLPKRDKTSYLKEDKTKA